MKPNLPLACFVLGLACLFVSKAAEANEVIARMFWNQLNHYETEAIRDYTNNNISKEVLDLSDHLWSLSSDALISNKYENCRRAARTLSTMVAGSYWSAKANEVAHDWLQYSPDYQRNRSACLRALGFEENDYQLPWWFGH